MTEQQQPDPVADILRTAQTSNRVRAAAWDAVYSAKDSADLEQRLRALPLPDETKADLWDVHAQRQRSRRPASQTQQQEAPNQVWEGVKATVRGLNPIPMVDALGRALIPEVVGNAIGLEGTGPINALTAAGQASLDVAAKARDAFGRGDYLEAGRRAVGTVPFVGPALDAAADKGMQGKYGEMVGDATAIGLATFGPQALANARVTVPAAMKPRLNPKEAAAVQFAEQHGIPVDAATAAGSPWLRNVQKRVASQPGGANRAEAFRSAQVEALERVGRELAEQANQTRTGRPGAPADAVSAGADVTKRLEGRINAQHRIANSAYSELRSLEQQAAQRIQNNRGHATAAPPTSRMAFTDVPLAVDVAAAKTSLRPLYESLLREKEIAGTLQGGKARTAVALEALMNGPDLAALSVVDSALGDLKALARTDGMKALRTSGQGTAARAVQALEEHVTATARAAGADVYNALLRGRQATAGKYKTAAVRDMLSVDEPGQVFRELTQQRDLGLQRLRAVAKEAPREIPKIARAYLDGLMDTATAEGGFGHADKLWAEWNKLGPDTKAILFRGDRAHIKALDNFFLLAKKVGENPNPSGTAPVLTALNVAGAPAMSVVARLLYSPKGVRALTQGFQTALFPTGRGRTVGRPADVATLAELTKAVRDVMSEPALGVADDSEPTASGRPQRR